MQLRAYVVAQRQASELLRLFDLILASGLRHDEAARLWESDLTRQFGFVRVRGTNAKGGRERTVGPNLDHEGLIALRAAIAAIPPGRHELWPGGPGLARRLEETMLSRAPLPMLALAASHGVYSYNLLFVPA